MLPGFERADDLVGMQRGGRGEEDGIEARVREQRGVIRVAGGDAQRVAGPCELVGDGAARRHERGALHAPREIGRVVAAHAADTGDADAHRGSVHRGHPLGNDGGKRVPAVSTEGRR